MTEHRQWKWPKYKFKWGDVGLVASGLGICAVYSWWIVNWKVGMTLGPLMALFGDDREAGSRPRSEERCASDNDGIRKKI